MTRALGILALAAAVGAVGCSNSQMAENGDMDSHMAENPAGYNQTADVRATGNAPLETAAGPSDASMKANPAALRDQQFVKDASAGGMYEIAAAKLAISTSSDAHVKDVAQRILADHKKANDDLMALAQKKSIPAAKAMTSDQQQMISKLQGLSGADFDREYLSQQTQAHKDTIAKFQAESTSGVDADLRTFATNTLPTLEHHLEMAGGTSDNGTRSVNEK